MENGNDIPQLSGTVAARITPVVCKWDLGYTGTVFYIRNSSISLECARKHSFFYTVNPTDFVVNQ